MAPQFAAFPFRNTWKERACLTGEGLRRQAQRTQSKDSFMSGKRSGSGFGWFVFLLLILLGGGGGYYWYQKDNAKKPIEYRIAKITRGEITQSVTASGQVTPYITVQVGSQVSGNIQAIHVDYNSTVTNGQLLAELDPSSFAASFAQAEGNLADAQAGLKLSELKLKRAKDLQALNPMKELEDSQIEVESSKARVKIQEARLLESRVNLARAKVYSPIAGTVISRNMDVGQTVAASFNAPVLFQIANDLRKMQVQAMVSEADIGGVEESQDVTFSVDAFISRTFRGRVEQVRFSPTTNQNVVTYVTVISTANDDLKLRPGMTANVSIITARQAEVLRISNGALRFRPPEGAIVQSNTPPAVASIAGAPKSPAAASGSGAGDAGPALEDMPEEIRQRILSRFDKNGDGKLDADETKAWREDREKRGRGPGGGGGRGPGGGGMGPQTKTVYKLEMVDGPNGQKIQQLTPVEVKLGISDGNSTEVKSGLNEGDEIVVGVMGFVPPTSAGGMGGRPPGQQNPFGGPGMRR